MNFAPVPPVPGLGWLFFGHRGRLGRRLFFQGWLFWVALLSACISAIMNPNFEQEPTIPIVGMLGLFVVTPLWLFSTLMLGFKRMHDMGIPGPVALVLLLPGPGLAAVILFSLWPPRMEANPYGDVRNGWQ